ncbi:MAG TPA: TonB-dependent receptor [Candidatus Syntrophosphaera thermopropionivorans]|nr:TonB-dependent receptor [Candidatus Syntrophosphaera thermopropionivorans]
MKSWVVTLCLAIIAVALTAESYLIQAVIVDPKEHPVSEVVISDGSKTVFSNEKGYFLINTSADTLTFHRLGFQEKKLSVKNIGKKVILTPEPVVLPRITVSDVAWNIVSPPPDKISLPIDPDRHYYSAGEVLTTNPAIHSNDVSLPGESQNISILGNLSRHSLIILDGVPLNPDGSSFDLSLLDPNNIESVDIIKNNVSVYGGSSAIGGIVMISTKKGLQQTGKQFSISTELGSFGYAQNSLSFTFNQPSTIFRINLSNLSTDNDFRYKVPEWWSPDSTAIRNNNAKHQNSLAASYTRLNKKSHFSFQTEYLSFMRQLPGTVNFTEIYKNASLSGWANRNRFNLNAPLFSGELGTLIWLNLDQTTYDNTKAPLPVYLSHYKQSLLNSGIHGSYGQNSSITPELSLNTSLSAEAGYNSYQNNNLLNSANNIDFSSRFANSILKTELKIDKGEFIWSNSGAIRYDLTEQENEFTWRLESSLQSLGYIETTIGGTLGTSFALPSPYDLYWKGDSQALGNPDLKSEHSQGWQIWMSNQWNKLYLKSAFHKNDIENLIQWRQIQMWGNVWKPLNIGKARIQNVEIEAGWQPWEWLNLSTSALFTSAKDISDQNEGAAPYLVYIPGRNYSLKMELNWKKLKFWSDYHYSGKQYTTPDNLTEPFPGYSLLDLGLNYSMFIQGWNVSPFFTIRNALNKQYEIYAYVPQPGIAFYGGVSLQVSNP